MFEAAFASQQLSHRRATDFRKKKTLSTTFSFLTFSLKILPGLAAMQPFLLHGLSLQALRRGAGRRRKGLVYQKNALLLNLLNFFNFKFGNCLKK